MRPIQYHPIWGAYTELYGGLSPEITLEQNGAWIIPWGRVGTLRADIQDAGISKEDGGSGVAEDFWRWSEEKVKDYL